MGLVYEANKDLIRSYKEEDVVIAGNTFRASGLSAKDVDLLVRKADTLAMSKLNPLVAEIVAAGMEDVINLVRMVNQNTKQGFGGMLAASRQLDLEWPRAKNFDPYGIGGTTWLVSDTDIPSGQGGSGTGTKTYKTSTTLTDSEGMIFLGFINAIDKPKTDAVLFYKYGKELGVAQNLNWDARPGFGTENLPVAKLQANVVVEPQASYRIDNYWFATGDDRLEPIAFHVKQAQAVSL